MNDDTDSGRRKLRTTVEDSLRPLTVPNFITLVRMAIVPFFVIAIFDQDFLLATWIFAVAGLSDALDGYLARRLKMGSVIGAYLDPVADKLLLTAAYIALTVPLGQEVMIPLWLTIIVLFRDLLITLVALFLFLFEDVTTFPASILGKLTTAMHLITVSVVLLANISLMPTWAAPTCFIVSFGLVIISGFNYIYRVSRVQESLRQSKPDPSED